jgi:hypothetical protein
MNYPFNVSLSILEDLGRNLYTTVPAVLSELIANAYDADATEVRIQFGQEEALIQDNGIGMSEQHIVERYLTVGYKRRNEGGAESALGRKVMGRKGIGKLAVFAIADIVTITTSSGEAEISFTLDYGKIEQAIRDKTEYHSANAEPSPLIGDTGTTLFLKLNRRASAMTAAQLKRRIARRFLTLGPSFQVFVNGEEVKAQDLRQSFPNIRSLESRSGAVGEGRSVVGWVASAAEPRVLKEAADEDTLNKIVVFTRGKVAHEDLLKHATDARVYTKYLFGELQAEFLDVDSLPDVATSSRQSFREDDERFQALVDFQRRELQHIRERWSAERSADSLRIIEEIESLKRWSEGLTPDDKRRAGQLFRKIGSLGLSKKKTRELVKFSVVAFETFRLKGNLDALDLLDLSDVESWAPIFASLETFEAALFLQVTIPRLKAIEKLKSLVDVDVRERFLQEYIAQELWLLDPTWDPISESPIVERDMNALVARLREEGDAEERSGRVDIKYAKATFGKHIIIELKRDSARTSAGALYDQVNKYQRAAQLQLQQANRKNETVEVVVLLGGLKQYDQRSEVERTLQGLGARIVFYRELIDNAETTYRSYIEANQKSGALVEVLNSVDEFFAAEED